MSDPDEVWFVQMRDLKTFLGPMPLDALTEMARTGALLRQDLVRHNEYDSWQSASEIPQLSGEFAIAIQSEETRDVVSLIDDESLTLADSVARRETAQTPALALPDDSMNFAFTGPSSDVIDFAAESPASVEPESTQPSQHDFETAEIPDVVNSPDTVSHDVASQQIVPAMNVTSPPLPRPAATIPEREDLVDENSLLALAVTENRPPWTAPAPILRPAPRRIGPSKIPRAPSVLTRLGEAFSVLPDWWNKPIYRLLVTSATLLGSLIWYFMPPREPERRPPPQTAEVVGVIRLNGKPVPNALVMFRPDRSKGTIGPQSVGQANPSGQFELTINNKYPGAVVGKHQVVVLSRDSAGSSASSSSVPVLYSQLETSPLTAEVFPDQLNEISLELKSK